MRMVLALGLALSLAAGSATAQTGIVGIFADPAGTSFALSDSPPMGLKLYYIVHVNTSGATGAQYRAKLPLCMTQTGAMWLADMNIYPVAIGNSQAGVAVAYGACRSSPIHVQTIQVFAMGTTPACCYWTVDADPAAGATVMVSDCDFNVIPGTGGVGIINQDHTCPGTPVEDTTWGRVKTMFDE